MTVNTLDTLLDPMTLEEQVSLLTWPVGIGVEEAPSPQGPFIVRSKDANPTWIVPASILRTRPVCCPTCAQPLSAGCTH